MSDASPAINWIGAAIGCLFTLAVARLVTRPTSASGYLGIGFLAFGIGIAFFFVGSLLHSLWSNRCGCARHTGTRIHLRSWRILRLSGLLGNSFPMFPFRVGFEDC